MKPAYDEIYLSDAMENLGEMFDYAARCGLDIDLFFSQFISTGIAQQFENGNPGFITGMSGTELAKEVLRKGNLVAGAIRPSDSSSLSVEYWAGWSLAYYHWCSGMRFSDMVFNGLTASKVCSLYILHEANPEKFAETADSIIKKNASGRESEWHEDIPKGSLQKYPEYRCA